MRDKAEPHVHGPRTSKLLSTRTWPDFERLFTANGGVWGGCWCMYFHKRGRFDSKAYSENKSAKHAIVEKGLAHGTIVYCGSDPVGWCQFGPSEELPRVDGKRNYVPTMGDAWRITCLFISRGHRGQGFADLAVKRSVEAIRRHGVFSVEAYPVESKQSASFLWSGTPELFEKSGFERVRPLGKTSWIYSLTISKPS